jgi:hypothetical protein
MGFNKGCSLFEEGCRPALFSRCRHEAIGVGWIREGDDIAFHPYEESGQKLYCASLDVRFPHDHDEVFLAQAVPYTYSDWLSDLSKWPEVPKKVIAQSSAGRDIEAFQIGNAEAKHQVCLVARAHPGESNASWVMRGCLDFLFGGGDEARRCHEALHWLIVPMLNPDGVATGRTRTNLAGVDLNRHHHDEKAPETIGLRAALQEEISNYHGSFPLAFIDIHSHPWRRGIFIIANGSDADPLVESLASQTELLDVAGTLRNVIQAQDEGIGRVAAARLGYRYSVTLESSLGARHAAAGNEHLTITELMATGRALCKALVDLADNTPPL